MNQYHQSLEEILSKVSDVPTNWMDKHAQQVIDTIDLFGQSARIDQDVIRNALLKSFDSTITIIRLILELSKDEFGLTFTALDLNKKAPNKTYFRNNSDEFMLTLKSMGLFEMPDSFFSNSYSWKDLILDRLKTGRGSAIRGQKRGRALEDWVEKAIIQVFGYNSYDRGVSFIGKELGKTAKADFAIPNKTKPKIVIEAKAYGATGSKQSDVIGDVDSIIRAKRHDTFFLLITDGITWNLRSNDLRKIVERQIIGDIYRIYTMQMWDDLIEDLKSFKSSLFTDVEFANSLF